MQLICILFNKDKTKVALIYRDYANDYTFPKGHIEENENIKECAIRETEEQNKMIEKCINEFLSMKSPSRELVINLIERVDIFEDKKLDIKFTFNIDLQTYV